MKKRVKGEREVMKKREKKEFGGGEGAGVVWGIGMGDPKMLCFWADRESRNVDVALLFSRRGSEPHEEREQEVAWQD